MKKQRLIVSTTRTLLKHNVGKPLFTLDKIVKVLEELGKQVNNLTLQKHCWIATSSRKPISLPPQQQHTHTSPRQWWNSYSWDPHDGVMVNGSHRRVLNQPTNHASLPSPAQPTCKPARQRPSVNTVLLLGKERFSNLRGAKRTTVFVDGSLKTCFCNLSCEITTFWVP